MLKNYNTMERYLIQSLKAKEMFKEEAGNYEFQKQISKKYSLQREVHVQIYSNTEKNAYYGNLCK